MVFFVIFQVKEVSLGLRNKYNWIKPNAVSYLLRIMIKLRLFN